jgi:hypothetical protein
MNSSMIGTIIKFFTVTRLISSYSFSTIPKSYYTISPPNKIELSIRAFAIESIELYSKDSPNHLSRPTSSLKVWSDLMYMYIVVNTQHIDTYIDKEIIESLNE